MVAVARVRDASVHFLLLNVNGVRSKEDNGSLSRWLAEKDPDLAIFTEAIDVTRDISCGGWKGKNFSHREWYQQQLGTRKAAYDRDGRSGGVCVLIKEEQWSELKPEISLVGPSLVKVKITMGGRRVHVFGLYLPGSWSDHRDSRVPNLLKDVFRGVPLEADRVVMGDFNAHSGSLVPENLLWSRADLLLPPRDSGGVDGRGENDEGSEEPGRPSFVRTSQCSKDVDHSGRDFIQICSDTNLVSLNGLTGEAGGESFVFPGECTHYSRQSSMFTPISLIDYILTDPSTIQRVSDWEVDFDGIASPDHVTISFSFSPPSAEPESEDALPPHQNLSDCPPLFCLNRTAPVSDEEIAPLTAAVRSFAKDRWPGLWAYHEQIEPFEEPPAPPPPPVSPHPQPGLTSEGGDDRACLHRLVEEWSHVLVGLIKQTGDKGPGPEGRRSKRGAWFDSECKAL
uniref:Endonuclease/exonuclease/phosphatase domain-containing protein n=1 Tax=Chromera velia CCMP2878 TaxID=1169474 RepID=A0A0G4HTS9_9ALVE|eukprot:Cvel_31546.t1-p1 / transcript=Cvel_31546.t1 / gene=Cvel_31546 / organism=Chromera_velia_CCMP2878 / gene_product=hypothetical protein / transcript_product=hypothetical protein / location=Cvel_scaffold4719:2106-3464(-) / protein_length=453 / sequence_SO=supercontig / SO=protein_coding / is_pseudo=false